MLMLISGNSRTHKAYQIYCERMRYLLAATIYTSVLLPLCKYLFMNQNETGRSDRMLVLISLRDLLVDYTAISNDYTTNPALCEYMVFSNGGDIGYYAITPKNNNAVVT